MTSFRVSVKSGEESIKSQFPFSFRLVFVFKVEFFKFGADINCSLKFSAYISNVLSTCTQGAGNSVAIDILLGSCNNLIACHFDQDHKTRRSVVEFWKLVNFQKCVHYWWKDLRKCHEVSTVISQSVKELFQSRQELCIVVGLDSCLGYFSLEFRKRICVGRFASFQKSQNSLDFNWLQLVVNWI